MKADANSIEISQKKTIKLASLYYIKSVSNLISNFEKKNAKIYSSF